MARYQIGEISQCVLDTLLCSGFYSAEWICKANAVVSADIRSLHVLASTI
jgi:hypothetical protein